MLNRAARRSICVLVLATLAACGDDDGGLDAWSVGDASMGDGSIGDGSTVDGSIGDAPIPGDAGPSDAGVALDAGDSGLDAGPDEPPPGSMFFVGNSFTFEGPVPELVRQLAFTAGFPDPVVEYRAVGGQSLRFHREDTSAESAGMRVGSGWDVVVLQDFSTRPTHAGDAEGFKEDANWFHDRALEANEDCRVVLYETWARHPDHGVYPRTYANFADMQAQLRFHYFDAAETFIPANSLFTPNVVVAPVGDAWELELTMHGDTRLHGGDDYHAGPAGQYLNALVLYSTIYHRRATGLIPIGVDAPTALALQESADLMTGESRPGPLDEDLVALPVGQSIELDIGPTTIDSWSALDAPSSATGLLRSAEGVATSVRAIASGFQGTQNGGSPANNFGWPGEVSRDSLYIGSSEGHSAALDARGFVTLRGVAPGTYEVRVFASRDGDDEGRGRLSRYRVDGDSMDLEAADNQSEQVAFAAVTPDATGTISVEVSVSPTGTARYGYIGAVIITRVE